MGTYSINDLERISGIKAHTIRIWEQRYSLLKPNRTESNIRCYNDDDVRKLLNVCTLIDHGMKISHASRMPHDQIHEKVNQILHDNQNLEATSEAAIRQCLIAILKFDAALFTEILDESIRRKGWIYTYRNVLYPLLVRTGMMWVVDDMLPVQEHFLSNLIRQKLFSAIDRLPVIQSTKKWLLFLDEHEDHEIGLLFASYIIRQHNQQVIYLGARVPYINLSQVIGVTLPTHIYSFIRKPETGLSLLENIRADFTSINLYFSGDPSHLGELASTSFGTYLPDVGALLSVLNDN